MLNPFSLMAVLYVTVGVFFAALRSVMDLPGAFGPSNLNWLRVHVITVGTILQLVFATLPTLARRKLGVEVRSPRQTWLQWALVNAGFVLVVTGIVGTDSWTATIGATVIWVAVWLLLSAMVRAYRAAGRPWRESLRFYATAPAFLLVGIYAAVSLVLNLWAPGGRVGNLEAHVHANVWGFLALIVAGTIFDLFPALTGTPMARPNWIRTTYWLITAGATGLVVGPWLNVNSMTLGGLGIYFVGTGLLLLNLVLTLVARRSATPAALHLTLSYLWMVVPAFFAPFILLAPNLVNAPAVETAATQGLINGWVMGMVMGAVPRLLRTKGWRADSSLFSDSNYAADGCWLTVAALNLGVAIVWSAALVSPEEARFHTIVGYGLIVVAWVPFLRRIWSSLVQTVESF
ncbi:MAG TPA: hypothetical protein VK464_24335 [Symbiobacteriaceae bacterium]|jgi:hypothetical protein|nr:hypothetical protein [Symbiobacteriaceae bacterium]